MRRRRKLLAWGTFCPTCLTVRTCPADVRVICHGGHRSRPHKARVVVVLDLFR